MPCSSTASWAVSSVAAVSAAGPDPAPAVVAGAVLAAIHCSPQAFDMLAWYEDPQGRLLEPGHKPERGTTLCVAGFTAHVTGWTLVDATNARKDDLYVRIEDVARNGRSAAVAAPVPLLTPHCPSCSPSWRRRSTPVTPSGSGPTQGHSSARHSTCTSDRSVGPIA